MLCLKRFFTTLQLESGSFAGNLHSLLILAFNLPLSGERNYLAVQLDEQIHVCQEGFALQNMQVPVRRAVCTPPVCFLSNLGIGLFMSIKWYFFMIGTIGASL